MALKGERVVYGQPTPAHLEIKVWADASGSSLLVKAQHSLDDRSQNLASVRLKNGSVEIEAIPLCQKNAPNLWAALPLSDKGCVGITLLTKIDGDEA